MQTNKGHVGTASAHLTLGCPAWPLFVNASAPNKTAPFRQVAVRDCGPDHPWFPTVAMVGRRTADPLDANELTWTFASDGGDG